MKGSLYRFYADGGALLYVGQSRNPFKRMDGHFKDKDMTDVRYIETEWFPKFDKMVDAAADGVKNIPVDASVSRGESDDAKD